MKRPKERVSGKDRDKVTQPCSGGNVSSEILIYMQTVGRCLIYHIIKNIGESIVYTAVKLFTLLHCTVS